MTLIRAASPRLAGTGWRARAGGRALPAELPPPRSRALPGGAQLLIVADAATGARLAAERIAAALSTAVADRGRADLATTGGSTPGAVYRELAGPLRSAVPWSSVHLWWGDERFVPSDHPLSNAFLAEQLLLGAAAYSGQSGFGASGIDIANGSAGGIVLPQANVHPVPIGLAIASGGGPPVAAIAFDAELRADGPPLRDGWPAFDAMLLGVGPDGHILSVFPGSSVWDERAFAVAIAAPTHVGPGVARVTLHPATIGAAGLAIVLVNGTAKSARLAEIVATTDDERVLPARAALRPNAVWIVDEAAASGL